MYGHIRQIPGEGVMRSVTVRIRAAEFSAAMTAIGEWLNANRYRPTRYKYDHDENAVFVTVDFPADLEARAFAMRFGGIESFPLQPASLDRPYPVGDAVRAPRSINVRDAR